MKQKLFVTLLVALIFHQSWLTAQLIVSPSQLCKPPKFCEEIVCTAGTVRTIEANGCAGCPQCLQKPKLCKPIFCPGVLCEFGERSQSSVLPNGCPGCRKCVKCERIKCEPIACINSAPTVLKNGCPGCPQCNVSLD